MPVVVSIIGLLVALLLPALAAARDSAVRVRCQSNLRSVSQLVAVYAVDHAQRVPLGYRGGRVQWNTMVYSGTSGSYVLFGRLERYGLLTSPQVLYCPAETAADQSFDTESNPWPPGEDPGANVQGGYASAPFVDWGWGALPPPPAEMPRLDEIGAGAMLGDGVGLPERLDSRHVDGVHVLYGDAGVAWADRRRFEASLSACTGLDPAFNDEQRAIWAELDRR